MIRASYILTIVVCMISACSTATEVPPICNQYNEVSSGVKIVVDSISDNSSTLNISEQLYIFESGGELTVTAFSGESEIVVRVLKAPTDKRTDFRMLSNNFHKILTEYSSCDLQTSEDDLFLKLYNKTFLNLPIIDRVSLVKFDFTRMAALITLGSDSVLGNTHYFYFLEELDELVYVILPNVNEVSDGNLNLEDVLRIVNKEKDFKLVTESLKGIGFKIN